MKNIKKIWNYIKNLCLHLWRRLVSVTPLEKRKLGIALHGAGMAGIGLALWTHSWIIDFLGFSVVVGAFLTYFYSDKSK